MDQPTETTKSFNFFNRSVETASDSVHKAIDKANHAASPMIDNLTNSAHHTVEQLTNGATHAADAIGHKGVQLQHLQQQLAAGARTQVRNHPLLVVSLAAAGAALLGLWLGHKNGSAK